MTAALQDEPGEDIAQALEDGWLPIREVARQTGVNAVTLRAWERRYGLIVPQRTPKGHRLFSHDHVQRIHTILTWLNRGVPVSQVEEPDRLRARHSADAGGKRMAHRCARPWCRPSASWPSAGWTMPSTRPWRCTRRAPCANNCCCRCSAELEQRWQGQFGAQMERVFFYSWLRSKFGARIYHNNRQLHGAPLLLVNHSDLPLEPHLWLSAWLASSADCPVEVFDWPLPAGELAAGRGTPATPRGTAVFKQGPPSAGAGKTFEQRQLPKTDNRTNGMHPPGRVVRINLTTPPTRTWPKTRCRPTRY